MIEYEIRDRDGVLIAKHIRKDYEDGHNEMPWDRTTTPEALPLYGIHEINETYRIRLPPSAGLLPHVITARSSGGMAILNAESVC